MHAFCTRGAKIIPRISLVSKYIQPIQTNMAVSLEIVWDMTCAKSTYFNYTRSELHCNTLPSKMIIQAKGESRCERMNECKTLRLLFLGHRSLTRNKTRRLHDRKTEHFKALTKNNPTSAIADHIKATGHNIKWDHFDILASGKTDYHCKIKESLLIQELKPALNVNVSSEKLILY